LTSNTPAVFRPTWPLASGSCAPTPSAHSYIHAAARERYGVNHVADHPEEAARAIAELEQLYAMRNLR
jgi:hypothetical protein